MLFIWEPTKEMKQLLKRERIILTKEQADEEWARAMNGLASVDMPQPASSVIETQESRAVVLSTVGSTQRAANSNPKMKELFDSRQEQRWDMDRVRRALQNATL
jgi:hypothetical protein